MSWAALATTLHEEGEEKEEEEEEEEGPASPEPGPGLDPGWAGMEKAASWNFLHPLCKDSM